jgi:hypothetical protein
MFVPLKKHVSSGISPFAIRAAPWVGEDELVIVMLSALESSPASSSSDGLVGRRLMLESVAMEGKARTMQQRSRKWWEGKSEKRWDEMYSSASALWWRFVSQKKVVFLFQPPTWSGHGIEEPKGWKFKRFWSPRRPREGTAAQRRKCYQPVRHGHLPEVKRKFWHKCPIVLSSAVPNRHLSESSVRLEAIKK